MQTGIFRNKNKSKKNRSWEIIFRIREKRRKRRKRDVGRRGKEEDDMGVRCRTGSNKKRIKRRKGSRMEKGVENNGEGK